MAAAHYAQPRPCACEQQPQRMYHKHDRHDAGRDDRRKGSTVHTAPTRSGILPSKVVETHSKHPNKNLYAVCISKRLTCYILSFSLQCINYVATSIMATQRSVYAVIQREEPWQPLSCSANCLSALCNQPHVLSVRPVHATLHVTATIASVLRGVPSAGPLAQGCSLRHQRVRRAASWWTARQPWPARTA